MKDIDSIDHDVLLTCEDVASRWGINQETLLRVVAKYNLEIYFIPSNSDTKYSIYNLTNWFDGDIDCEFNPETDYEFNYETDKPRDYRPILPELGFFRRSVIKTFEKSNPDLIKMLKDQFSSPVLDSMLRNTLRHKERCRSLAQYIWEQTPSQTIAAMVRSCALNKIGCERTQCGDNYCKIKNKECNFGQHGNPYPEETMKGWIRDLSPNPNKKGGRPPNTN
jgi:hypothetical protein